MLQYERHGRKNQSQNKQPDPLEDKIRHKSDQASDPDPMPIDESDQDLYK